MQVKDLVAFAEIDSSFLHLSLGDFFETDIGVEAMATLVHRDENGDLTDVIEEQILVVPRSSFSREAVAVNEVLRNMRQALVTRLDGWVLGSWATPSELFPRSIWDTPETAPFSEVELSLRNYRKSEEDFDHIEAYEIALSIAEVPVAQAKPILQQYFAEWIAHQNTALLDTLVNCISRKWSPRDATDLWCQTYVHLDRASETIVGVFATRTPASEEAWDALREALNDQIKGARDIADHLLQDDLTSKDPRTQRLQ